MTTQSGTLAARVARIEAVLDHLAPRADLERLKLQLFAGLAASTGIILVAIRLAS